MKTLKKITALALSLIMAGAAAAPAYADWETKNGKTYYQDDNGDYVTGWQIIDGLKYYFNENGEMVTKNTVVDGIYYKFDKNGVCQGSYTGWTKNKSGKRSYYDKGAALTGWRMINGKRYHFNEKGYADTGKVKIAGCTYTFSQKGVWTGKRSKAGARPDDFSVSYTSHLEYYSSETGKFQRKTDYDENGELVYACADIPLSKKDQQIIWSIITENELLKANVKTYYDTEYARKIAQKTPGKYNEIGEDEHPADFTLVITANGKKYEFKFTDDIQWIIGDDNISAGLWNSLGYLRGFIREQQSFKNLPPVEDSVRLD